MDTPDKCNRATTRLLVETREIKDASYIKSSNPRNPNKIALEAIENLTPAEMKKPSAMKTLKHFFHRIFPENVHYHW